MRIPRVKMTLPTLITGASSGLGAELALLLAADGDPVALVARRGEMILELSRKILGRGGRAVPIVCNVADREAVQEAFALAQKEIGPIERLVANAGVGIPTPVDNFKIEDAEKIIRTNLMGTIYCVEAALPWNVGKKERSYCRNQQPCGFSRPSGLGRILCLEGGDHQSA
jgi:NAD(P)-dependent dehydrogenase (short-subunit alcohol dehydrogenase family)